MSFENTPDYFGVKRYRITKQIGEGGGGTVFLGTDSHLQKEVVLKKIKGAEKLANVRTEVDILKNLRHSNIPQVYDFLENEDGVYTVMDYIPGETIQKKLDSGYSFKEAEVIKYGKELCDALAYLHSQNPPLIHGDIKPDNIIITPDNHVCLIDFNISGILEGEGMQTNGYTPGYSSPEQIEACRRIMEKASGNVTVTTTNQDDPYTGSEGTVLLNTESTEKSDEDMNATVLLDTEGNAKDSSTGGDATVLLENVSTPNRANESKFIKKTSSQGATIQKSNTPKTYSDSTSKMFETSDGTVLIDRRSDIYSVGATLYTMLTGKRISENDGNIKLEGRISNGLKIIVLKSLEIRPKSRYQSAKEMIDAFADIATKDNEYRELVFRQVMQALLFAVLLLGSLAAIWMGSRFMAVEKDEKFSALVDNMQKAYENGLSKDEAETIFAEAIAIHDDLVDIYEAKAAYLYLIIVNSEKEDKKVSDEFETLIKEVENKKLSGNDEMLSVIYNMYADYLYSQDRYAEAVKYYSYAYNYNRNDFSMFFNHSLALIYQGKGYEVERLLERADKYNINKGYIELVRGEIARSESDYEEAISIFKNVAETTLTSQESTAENQDIARNAVLMAGQVYFDVDTVESLKEAIEWYNKDFDNITEETEMAILDNLAKAYIRYGELTEDSKQYRYAMNILSKVLEANMGTDTTYNTYVVLYERMGDLNSAKLWADKLCERYPNHYTSYMRRAYIELEIQENSAEQDYQAFAESYRAANNLYIRTQVGNNADEDMSELTAVYNRLVNENKIN